MAATGIPRGQVEEQHLLPSGVARQKWPFAESGGISAAVSRFMCVSLVYTLDGKIAKLLHQKLLKRFLSKFTEFSLGS